MLQVFFLITYYETASDMIEILAVNNPGMLNFSQKFTMPYQSNEPATSGSTIYHFILPSAIVMSHFHLFHHQMLLHHHRHRH